MWTLIIFIYVGTCSNCHFVAIDNVSGFKGEENCMVAGKKLMQLTVGTQKLGKYVCVKSYG